MNQVEYPLFGIALAVLVLMAWRSKSGLSLLMLAFIAALGAVFDASGRGSSRNTPVSFASAIIFAILGAAIFLRGLIQKRG